MRTRKLLPAKFLGPNITQAERSVFLQMKECNVGYNNADKNRGPVIYSKKLYAEQCRLHLEDDKGTYCKTLDRTNENIIKEILVKLCHILIPFRKHSEGWKAERESIFLDASDVAKKGRLCKFYLIWKLHKMANAAGILTGPLLQRLTTQALHGTFYIVSCRVLKDSLDLIREFETASFSNPRLTWADVVVLYPSILLELGMAALLWFMDNHTSFNQTLKDLCLRLANFVLTNNYLEY